jgi:hypothetical protein
LSDEVAGAIDPRERKTVANTRRRLALVGALLLVALAAAYWFTQGPGVAMLSPAGSTVVELSGSGDQTSNSFRVRAGWEIHWETTGEHLAVAISGGKDVGTVISQDQPGSGVAVRGDAGNYQLEVRADGPWTIRVTQGQ